MTKNPVSKTELQAIVQALGKDVHRFAGKTVLLTGGCGFLGRYIQAFFVFINRQTLAHPCRLISVDNLITAGPAAIRTLKARGVTTLQHDIIQPLKIEGRVDYIIHAAGIASPYYYRKYPLETLQVATSGTRHMLQLALEKRTESFVFFSSSEIYGDPDEKHVPTPESYRGNVACLGPRACYDESKRLGETLCYVFHQTHGVKAKIVRPFNVYGPGMQQADYRVLPNFAGRILAGKPVSIYGTGEQTRTFCYISDAVTGFLKVLLRGIQGEAYNVGNSNPEISMLELARLFGQVIRKKVHINRIEYPDAYPADEPMRRCPDLTKIRMQLAYEPVVPLKEGLRRFMKWAEKTYHPES